MKLSGIGKSKKSASLLLASGLACFGLAVYLNKMTKRPAIFVSAQDSSVNFSTNFLKLGSFGNKRLISDVLWTQTLLQSDLEQYKKKDLNNWMFLRFKTISDLDPLFYENYLYGGQFLSVIKDDLDGASIIFEKGLNLYPDDYQLNYFAGFMYYFEKNDFQQGLAKMGKIQFHSKAPVYFPSIVNKLKLESGNVSLTTIFSLVHDQFKASKDEALQKKLSKDLYAIKAEIDLKCLNNKETGCELLDFYGYAYIKKNDVYHTQQEFLPYRIKKRGDPRDLPKSITTFK